MAEDTQQEEVKTPVSDTQDAPVPSAEQKTSEETVSDQVTDQTVEPEIQTDNARTAREFDKLREQLRDERVRREMLEASFSKMQQPKEQTLSPIYDPDTGLYNDQAQQERDRLIIEANQKAQKAEQQIQAYNQRAEEDEAYMVHPELRPGEGQDKNLHNLTKSLILQSMVEPQSFGNRQLSMKEAADEAKKMLLKGLEGAKKEGAQQALEQLTPKEQASLEADSSVNAGAQSDLSDLQRRSRKGDLDAIVARLKNTQQG